MSDFKVGDWVIMDAQHVVDEFDRIPVRVVDQKSTDYIRVCGIYGVLIVRKDFYIKYDVECNPRCILTDTIEEIGGQKFSVVMCNTPNSGEAVCYFHESNIVFSVPMRFIMKPQFDWTTVEVDTKIYVRDNEECEWLPRYFSYYDGRVHAFQDGRTSFTSSSGERAVSWALAKLA